MLLKLSLFSQAKRNSKALGLLLVIICLLSIGQANATCSVSTDKSQYNLGETVTFQFSVDCDCTASLAIVLPDGSGGVFYSEDVTAGTHQTSGTASEPCGTHTVILKVSCNGGVPNKPKPNYYLADSSSSNSCEAECTYDVICPQPSGCTETYRCNNNVAERLCYQNGNQYWQVSDDCNAYSPQRQCVNGNCVDVTPPQPSCNQQACQSKSGPIDQPYIRDGKMYQRYRECNCVGGNCQCSQVEKEVPCTGIISGKVTDSSSGTPISGASIVIGSWSGTTNANGAFSSYQAFCPSTTYVLTCSAQGYVPISQDVVTDGNGNAYVPLTLQLSCSGTISGHVSDINTKSPIPGATLLICPSGGDCWSPPPVDSTGLYSSGGKACPSTTYDVTCSVEGYKSSTQTVTTDNKGNAWQDFKLEPNCQGEISGHVSDFENKSPIIGATLLICKKGGDCWSPAPVDSTGLYSSGKQVCPSTSYDLTCSAEGYNSSTLSVTTDDKGNAWQDFKLKRNCQGILSGKVLNSITNEPVQGANLLICQNGKCFDPVITDSSGQYTLSGLCPLTDYEITCSAEGYKTYENTGTTKDDGNSLHEILLEPDCQGTISGKVLDATTKATIQGANLLVCTNGKCMDPVITDSEGQFSLSKVCPSISYDITCSASGYITYQSTNTTDDKGNSLHEILLEPECKGAISGKVLDGLTNNPVQGASITICHSGKCSDPVTTDSAGQYSFNKGCPSSDYEITCSASGYQTYKNTGKTDEKGNSLHEILLERELTIKVWTDKTEYKAGEEVTIHYETSIESAGRRISITSTGSQTPPFNQVFGENTFAKEKSGTRKFTPNKAGTYEIKLEAWTDNDKKEDQCTITVCGGTISGKVLNSLTNKPVQGATIAICINGNCSKPIVTDASGQYSSNGFCPAINYDITCSASGYQTYKGSSYTDESGNSLHEILLEPECKGTISGKVLNSHTNKPVQGATITFCVNDKCLDPVTTDSAGQYSKNGCPSTSYNVTCSAPGYKDNQGVTNTDGNGNAVYEIQLEPECKGTISGKVLNSLTNNPVQGAKITICQDVYNKCSDPVITDSSGQFVYSKGCSVMGYKITCSADGYKTYQDSSNTDDDGNSLHEILLEPEGQGAISGKVLNSLTNKLVKGATVTICVNGKCLDPVTTDSAGQYSKKGYPSIDYEITCSASGYQNYTNTGKTDEKGNSLHEILLEPNCQGTISGKVLNSRTNKPVQGASVKICQSSRCSDPITTDEAGQYSMNKGYPSVDYNITCTAQGYITYQKTGVTDDKGNSLHEILLEPNCNGMISGKVINGLTNKPIQGASVKICQYGKCSDPVITGSSGQYSFNKGCPSISYNITCLAKGYKDYSDTGITDDSGNSLNEILLEPDCSGKISGKVLDGLTNKPIQGASIKVCQSGRCSDPVTTDSAGQYSLNKGCPSIDYNITCTAQGYETVTEPGNTDEKGNSPHDFLLEPICDGTISGKVLDGQTNLPVQSASIKICQHGRCSDPVITDSSGQYSFNKGCPSIDYNITCTAQGYETVTESGNTDNKGNSPHDFLLEPSLALKISTDTTEYKTGENVIIHYETGVENAGRRITVMEQGTKTTLFTKTFGENDFQKEKSGTRNLTIDKPGTYMVKLEAWTSKEHKDASCKFNVSEKDLALKIWTDKTEYKVGDEATIYYQTGAENAGRRIIVSLNGTPVTTFGENNFPKEANGTKKLTLNKSGAYTAKLQAWTSKESKDASCEFNVVENRQPIIISISASPKSPQQLFTIKTIGIVLVLTKASDPDNDSLQYKFELRKKGEDFKVTQDFSAMPLWIWEPQDSGEYEIRGTVTDGKSEVNQIINYSIINRPPVFWMSLEPPIQAQVGTKVNCSVTAFDLDSDTIQFKFWLKGPSTNNQWQAKTDWISIPTDGFFSDYTWNWMPGPTDVGKNEIDVWVRDGSHAGPDAYDAHNVSSYEIVNTTGPNGAQFEITSLKALPQSPQELLKSPKIMCSIQASNPGKDALRYQFELKKEGSDFKVTREFSAMPIWTWEPKEAGNYEIKGVAQNSKGQTAVKVIDYSITGSKENEIKFNGTLYRSNAPMGFAVYYFKVDKILEGANIPVGDPIGVDIYDDSKPLGERGHADSLREGDKAEVYASIDTDKGKWNDGYEIAWLAGITGDKKYYINKIGSGNEPPKLLFLEPDKPSPQNPNTQITWMAKAEDPDNDIISYRFELKGPSSHDYKVVKDWSQENTWTWNAGNDDTGNNTIRVQVKDGKHGDVDDEAYANYTIEPKLEDIRFIGTCYRNQTVIGFRAYYFKADKILEGPDIPKDDLIAVYTYESKYAPDHGGSYDALDQGDQAEVYASIDTSKGKYNTGFETAWQSSIVEDKRYYVKKITPELEINVSTDKPEYEIGDEVNINYETNIENAGRRITVSSVPGTQTPSFSKEFSENDLASEKSGTCKLEMDEPGIYVVKLEAWIGNEHKDVECKFVVNELKIEVSTDKQEYNVGEETTINYNINIGDAHRQIVVDSIPGSQTSGFSKTFTDDTFSKDKSGAKKLILNIPGTYEVKFDAWTTKQNLEEIIDFNVVGNEGSKPPSQWTYELTRNQYFSKVRGDIIEIEPLEYNEIDDKHVAVDIKVTNTRSTRYNVETYKGPSIGENFYDRTFTLTESNSDTGSNEITIRAVRGLKCSDPRLSNNPKLSNAYVATIDVNVDYGTYFLEHVIGLLGMKGVKSCKPTTETLVTIKDGIKSESFPNEPMSDVSLQDWALKSKDYFVNHPDVLVKAVGECGVDYAAGQLLDLLTGTIYSKLTEIIALVQNAVQSFTEPSEETVTIYFYKGDPKLT